MKQFVALMFFGALATASLSVADAQQAAATDPTNKMDCSQAESMLEDAVKTKIPTMMTGNVDKDFATIITEHEKVSARINQIEAVCGKDQKMQAMAQKDAASAQLRMEEFRNQGTSN